VTTIEVERTVVVVLCIDEGEVGTTPSHPSQRIEQQRCTKAAARSVGADGKTLEVCAPACHTRQCVPGGIDCAVDAQDAMWRCVERLAECGFVEPPESFEGVVVDVEYLGELLSSPPPRPHLGFRDGRVEGSPQEREAPQWFEPVLNKRRVFLSRESCSDGALVTAFGQCADDFADRIVVETLVDECGNSGHLVVTMPWPDPNGATPPDRQVLHALVPGSVRSATPRF